MMTIKEHRKLQEELDVNSIKIEHILWFDAELVNAGNMCLSSYVEDLEPEVVVKALGLNLKECMELEDDDPSIEEVFDMLLEKDISGFLLEVHRPSDLVKSENSSKPLDHISYSFGSCRVEYVYVESLDESIIPKILDAFKDKKKSKKKVKV